MILFDASALLAYLLEEPGAEAVRERLLEDECCCIAANWSEVAQKIIGYGGNWPASRGLLVAFGIAIEPVTLADAEAAALLWKKGDVLSLADRLCLAAGARLGARIFTCDKAWAGREGVVVLR